MGPEQKSYYSPAIRAKMKGVFVKVLQKARPQPGKARPAGGYVQIAHSGIRKMFGADQDILEPRLDLGQPAPRMSSAVDPVRLVADAMEVLSPASFRASVVGRPVTVTAADEATAEIFRAALEKSAVNRPTDGLIVVKVRGDA